jgi:hypothetical protein
MWGDGKQTRSFTFIDDCVEGILRITKSDFRQPLNLGSCEMVRGCGWLRGGVSVGGCGGGWSHACLHPCRGASWLSWPGCVEGGEHTSREAALLPGLTACPAFSPHPSCLPARPPAWLAACR